MYRTRVQESKRPPMRNPRKSGTEVEQPGTSTRVARGGQGSRIIHSQQGRSSTAASSSSSEKRPTFNAPSTRHPQIRA
ncbi:hypothetical protein V9T40_001670 [Parthenolecanium corni]|uniref:Uncharacterized protein n=1 Tax=Parthenolecanium corni TaxID=536013 RepID=A0AAN9TL47_9HEMI